MKKSSKQSNSRKIFYIILGSFIMSVGIFFFNVPSQIAAGGVTGFSQVIQYLLPNINLGLIIGFLNLVIFLLGAYFLGKEFGVFTLIGTVSLTGFIYIFDQFIVLEKPILNDNLANLVIGGSLVGYGLAFVFTRNASTGGTDVIAKIIEKFSDISISTAIIIVDTCVILFAASTFGFEQGIYSFMSLLVTTFVLDFSITGFNRKIEMTIISNKVNEINEFVKTDIFRGTTLYLAKGGYTRQEKEILVTVVDKKQYIKIRNFIRNIDEDAFVYTKQISEVIGYGFSREYVHDTTRENSEIGD